MLADYFSETGNDAAAIENYNLALRENPNDPWGHFFLGQLYARTGSSQADIEFMQASNLSVEVAKEVEDFRHQMSDSGVH